MTLDELIYGAWDLHCHVCPETSLEQAARMDDLDLVRAVAEAGMAGVVLKSHLWPTATRAYYLQRARTDVRVLGSVTLNGVSGGVSPLAVEAAARLGARVVFFPTWQARHDVERGGSSAFMQRVLPLHGRSEPGLGVEADGRLTAEAQEVLAASREFRMVTCTGHLSPQEGLLLCAAGRQLGLPMIFSHPMAASVGASIEQMRTAAEMGALVEFCALQFTVSIHRSAEPNEVVRAISEIGPEHCVLTTTDAFHPWAPPAPELLRLAVGILAELGIRDADLRQMVVDNPRRVLGM